MPRMRYKKKQDYLVHKTSQFITPSIKSFVWTLRCYNPCNITRFVAARSLLFLVYSFCVFEFYLIY